MNLAEKLDLNSMPVPECGCQIWMAYCHRAGHGHIMIARKPRRAHRVAWELKHGPIPDGMHVLHRCNVPSCINTDHLYLGTDLENARDRMAAGTHKNPPHMPGEKHPQARLSVDQVREIRGSQLSGLELAAKFSMHPATISAIRVGRLWRHI